MNEKPKSFKLRQELGHWEANTVIEKLGEVFILTLEDRKAL